MPERTRRDLWPIASTILPSGREMFLVNGAMLIGPVSVQREAAPPGEINPRTGHPVAELVVIKFPSTEVKSVTWDELKHIADAERGDHA